MTETSFLLDTEIGMDGETLRKLMEFIQGQERLGRPIPSGIWAWATYLFTTLSSPAYLYGWGSIYAD